MSRKPVASTKRKLQNKKLNVPLQREFLERMLAYILYAEEIDLDLLERMSSMFGIIDTNSIAVFEDRKILSEMIQKGLEILLERRIEDPMILRNELKSLGETHASSLEEMDTYYNDPQNAEECLTKNIVDYIGERISNITQYAMFYQHKDDLTQVVEKLNSGDVKDISAAASQFMNMADKAMNDISNSAYNNDSRFDYISGTDSYVKSIQGAINEANRPSAVMKTGIRELNSMLGGGFKSTRHYTFLGAPGTGKSVMLENALCWMCTANKGLQPQDPTKEPIVLYCTQENDLNESNERQYYVGLPSSISLEKEFKDRSGEEISELYTKCGWNIKFARMYRENREISTRDLDNYCEKLSREGYEVVAIIHDYIKRIRASHEINDPYVDYGEVVNDEKKIAVRRKIPFLTVMQVNREAVRHICEAQARGKDIEKEVNPSFIGDSFPIFQNTDFCAMLVPQEDPLTGITYMQIMKLKCRYRNSMFNGNYLAIPYEKGTIRMEQNVGKTGTNVRTKWCANLVDYNPAATEVGATPKTRKIRRTHSENNSAEN